MKKFLVFTCAVLLGTVSRNSFAEKAKEDLVFSVNDTRVEGAFYGGCVAIGGFLLANQFLNEVPYVKWGSIPAGLVIGCLGSYWGGANCYTSSAYLKSAQKILKGRVSNPVLLEKICSLAKESAIDVMDALIKAYGHDEASKALKKLREEIDVVRRWLFEVIKGSSLKSAWWTAVIGKTEQEELELSKKKVTAVLRSIDCAQKLLSLKKQFDQMCELLKVEPIAVRLQGMSVDNEREVVSHLYELYGKDETAKELSAFVRLVTTSRKKLISLQKQLPFLSVEQEKFDSFVCKVDVLLKNADAAVEIVDSAEAFKEVKRVMNGGVSEPMLLGIMRSELPSINEVVNFVDKHGFPRALERLGRLSEYMEEAHAKLSLCQGGACDVMRAEVCRIQENIQTIAQQIREDQRFTEQNEEFLREMQIKTKHESALNKGVSLRNEQKELRKQIEASKAEQQQYELECIRFERDKTDFEYQLERQKTKTYDAKIHYEQQKVAVLEREARALCEKEKAVEKVKNLYDIMAEAQRELEKQKEKTEQAARLRQNEKDEFEKLISKNRAKLREIIDVTNDHTKELKTVKKQVEKNKDMISGSSQTMNQLNNPSHNPEYTQEYSEDQSASAPAF